MSNKFQKGFIFRQENCVGCGGCESICPVRPMRAIIVKANTVHQTIVLPEEEDVKNVEVDDFGF